MNRLERNLKLINAKDLIFVILYGGVLSILLGVAFGMVDYYLSSLIKISLYPLFFFLGAQFIGSRVRAQYDLPHLVYTVITGVFLVVQGLILYVLPFVYDSAIFYRDYSLLYNLGYYARYVWYLISATILSFNIDILLYWLILGVGTYLGVRRTY